jgi:hypothetical protein
MMLVDHYHSLLQEGWGDAFEQERTLHRAMEHAVAIPCCLGRRTISRAVCALDRHHQDWSADYKIYSRGKWNQDDLFNPVFDAYLQEETEGPVCVIFDDTKLAKEGVKVPGAFWQRDPLSPPFHVNFLYGLRFIQGSLLFPHYQRGEFDPRAIPVRFTEAPTVKKPGKRASEAERQAYRKAKREHNLSVQTLELIRNVRRALDLRGGFHRKLLCCLDGSFCNRTIFRAQVERTELLARCRKDARLCFAAEPGQRRKYQQETFTPEQIRQEGHVAWREATVWFGGRRRSVRYKEVRDVLWRRGAGTRPLRLIVLAPQPYKLSLHSKTNYREPAYLLCTDLVSPIEQLIQACFDRWQIEVNHRDEKDILGVGQAQVRSPRSVPRQPAFAVATYSMMLLAALQTFGPGRTDDYVELPKWRKHARRPSILDIITLMRKEINETRDSGLVNIHFSENLFKYAYT